jgi:hypothetical protein
MDSSTLFVNASPNKPICEPHVSRKTRHSSIKVLEAVKNYLSACGTV